MEAQQVEKVYVAVGNDLQDGFRTLDWTLKKWNPDSISIVILHLTLDISKDFVYTPFGKLPASSMSDEKLQVLKKYEQEKIDKLLSKYIAFCGKVKAEILKVEKYDEPIHKLIVDLISGLRITKLVLGITFMKSSSLKSKSAISGSFYIHQHKPNFCEFFIVCGGKLVLLRDENDEGILEDDQGVMLAKMREKCNLGTCFGKMFTENSVGRNSHHLSASSTSLDSSDSQNQWENYVIEIENYFQNLLSLNLDEEICEQENEILQTGPTMPHVSQHADCSVNVEEKMESVKLKIAAARKMIQLKREEAKANAERFEKAEWAVGLCTRRAEKLESRIKEEITIRMDIKKDLDSETEQIHEIRSDVEESKNRLNSLLELQSELSNKLQVSSLAKSHMEAQLEKAVVTRAEMVREIEELRRQRDVLHRRIEFCREKDAIGMVTKLNDLRCGYREYTAEDIRLATDDFSERLRLKSGGDWANVYRGRINHATIAIKMINPANRMSKEDFQAKVKFLANIRHPHLIAIMGFCCDPKCIILEYMHSGSLREILLSPQRFSTRRNRVLRWHDRVRIAYEVCSGLGFLHLAQPRPLIHGGLTASRVLVDRNLVAKISGFGLSEAQSETDPRKDIRAFGVLLLTLLTGKNWAGLVGETTKMDRGALERVLNEMGGQWPLDLAEELVRLAMRCLSVYSETNREEMSIERIRKEVEEIKKKADEVASSEGGVVVDREDPCDIPSVFLCPIFQEVMKNPHVAADGFSYELEAIEEWLGMGRDTSPMTNLRLKHKFLTPNHTLRSLIQDWQTKKSRGPS